MGENHLHVYAAMCCNRGGKDEDMTELPRWNRQDIAERDNLITPSCCTGNSNFSSVPENMLDTAEITKQEESAGKSSWATVSVFFILLVVVDSLRNSMLVPLELSGSSWRRLNVFICPSLEDAQSRKVREKNLHVYAVVCCLSGGEVEDMAGATISRSPRCSPIRPNR